MVQRRCAPCGFVSDVDTRDKLTSFILKKPPEPKKGSKENKAMRRAEKERLKEGEVADEELKKLKKGSSTSKYGHMKGSSTKKKASGYDEDGTSPILRHAVEKEDDDVPWQTDASMEAAIQEQLSNVTADRVMLFTSELQISKATSNESEGPKSSSPSRGISKAEKGNSAHERVVKEMKTNLKKGVAANEFQSFLRSLNGSAQTAFYEAIFDGFEKGFTKEVFKKKRYIAAAVAQGEESRLLPLRASEGFCGKSSLTAVKEVALVLKALYDADVLEEEYIVKLYQDGSTGGNKGSPFWKNVTPFIGWLQSAESESESE